MMQSAPKSAAASSSTSAGLPAVAWTVTFSAPALSAASLPWRASSSAWLRSVSIHRMSSGASECRARSSPWGSYAVTTISGRRAAMAIPAAWTTARSAVADPSVPTMMFL